MKKYLYIIIIFIFIILVLFILTKCTLSHSIETTTVPIEVTTDRMDKDKPIITITPSVVTITQNQEINLLDGVTAFDQIDKDLTNRIEINQGNFNSSILGEYIISYRVTDTSGNVGVATKKIYVLDPALVFNRIEEVYRIDGNIIAKGDLYTKLKNKYGFQTFLDLVDRKLLAEYQDDLVITTNIDEEDYISLATTYGLVKLQNESFDDFNQRVIEKLSIEALRKRAVIEEVKKTVSSERLTQLKNEYIQEACVMVLSYSTLNEANQVLNTLNSLEGDALENQFKLFWEEQYSHHEMFSVSYTPYLNSLLPCQYERVTSAILKMNPYQFLRNKIYNELSDDTYNQSLYLFDNYYIVYRDGVAPDPSTYDTVLFEQDLLNRYVASMQLDLYGQLKKLREEADLTIYDGEFYHQYGFYDNNKPDNNDNLIATIKDKNITKNDLYDELEQTYFLDLVLDHMNQKAINLNGISVTEKDLFYESMRLDLSIEKLKSYWFDNILRFIETDELKLNTLINKYLLSQYPIDLQGFLDSYYNIDTITLNFNMDQPHSQLIINQLISGVNENEEAFVYLNNSPFMGLNNIPQEERINTLNHIEIRQISSTKTVDSFTNYNGSHHQFEELFRLLSNEEIGSFKAITIDNQFYIFLLTNDIIAPDKPVTYDEYSDLDLLAMSKLTYDQETLPILDYYRFIHPVKTRLENERLNSLDVEIELATLRDQYEITIQDEKLKSLYDLYQHYILNH